MAEDALGEFIAGLMKTIHVELPDEAVHLAVPKKSGQDDLLELGDVLYDELATRGRPVYYLGEFVALNEK